MTKELEVSEKIAHCTVLIEVDYDDGRSGTGTGFIVRFADDGKQHIPPIVTNKHVVAGAVRGRFRLSPADADGNPAYSDHYVFSFGRSDKFWIPHPEDEVDLCVMPSRRF